MAEEAEDLVLENRETLWGTYAVNPDTNMPVLPEGYFWRIVSKRSDRYVDVYLMQNYEAEVGWLRKRTVQKTRRIQWSVIDKEEVSSRLIFERATMLLKKMKKARGRDDWWNAEPFDVNALDGDYPPQKLPGY